MLSAFSTGPCTAAPPTTILVNVPGEAASVVTAIDGYKMARKGRAGAALSVAAVGSFVAGTLGVVAMMFFAPPLAEFALQFGPPEFCALTFLGLIFLAQLGGGSVVKNYLMLVLGLMMGTVGMDLMSGESRFTFGQLELGGGWTWCPWPWGSTASARC